MPRTAETSRRQSDQRTSTTSSDPRAGELARTPVLFRLPTIELDLAAAAFQDDAVSPTGKSGEELEYVDKPLAATAGQVTSAEPFQTDEFIDEPEPISADTDGRHGSTANVEPPLVKTQNIEQPAVTQALVNPPVADSVEVTPASEAQNSGSYTFGQPLDEPQRSWWDHWSSGVVLILLIIALVTASIIAFNDKSQSDPDLVAQQTGEGEASESEFDLGNIQIPDVKESMRAEIVSGTPVDSSIAADSVKTGTLESPTGEPASAESKMQLTSTPSTQAKLPSASLQQPSAGDSEVPAETEGQYAGLIPESLDALSGVPAVVQSQAGATANNLNSSTSSLPRANLAGDGPAQSLPEGSSLEQPPVESKLMQPVAQEQPALFPELPLPTLSADQAPDLGASMSSAQSGNPKAAAGVESGVPSTNLPGYGELLNTSNSGTTSGQTVSGNANQATFSTAGLKNAEGTNAVGSKPDAASRQVDGGVGANGTVASEAAPSGTRPIPTATPNQDPDAIIRAYQYYIQMAGEASEANRYATPPQQTP